MRDYCLLHNGILRKFNRIVNTNVDWFVELESKLIYLKNNILHIVDYDKNKTHKFFLDYLLPIKKFYHMNDFIVVKTPGYRNEVIDLKIYKQVTNETCFDNLRNSKTLKQIANCIYTDNHILYCGRQYMHVSNLDNYVFDNINAVKITNHVVLINKYGRMKVLKLSDIKSFMLNGMYLVYNKKMYIINYSETGLVYRYCYKFNGKVYVNKCGVNLMIFPEEKIVVYFTTSGICCWCITEYLDDYGGLNECVLLY